MTKIGEAKSMLSDAIRQEFGGFKDRIEDLSALATQLSSDSTGFNGVSAFWRGLHQQLEAMANTIEEKEREVLATLEGKPRHQIQAQLDPEQVERVQAARDEVTPNDATREEAAHEAAA